MVELLLQFLIYSLQKHSYMAEIDIHLVQCTTDWTHWRPLPLNPLSIETRRQKLVHAAMTYHSTGSMHQFATGCYMVMHVHVTIVFAGKKRAIQIEAAILTSARIF